MHANTKTSQKKAPFARAHVPKPSATLMRNVVKKPRPSLKRQTRAIGPANYEANLEIAKVTDTEPRLLKHERANQSLKVKKSKLISHFDARSFIKPVISTPGTAQPLATMVAAQPRSVTLNKARTTADILERALERATSHTQPAPKLSTKKRRRLASMWTASALIALIIALGVSQNLTSIRLQLASAKAGFTASLPRDMPGGFSLSQLAYSGGVVATLFRSNSSKQTYSITQRITSWDNQALKQNFLIQTDPNYQMVVAESGLTVYFYGDHNASWVSNGIWYVIQSNGTLSDHELLEMASST